MAVALFILSVAAVFMRPGPCSSSHAPRAVRLTPPPPHSHADHRASDPLTPHSHADHRALELWPFLAQLPEQLRQQRHVSQAVGGATPPQLVALPGQVEWVKVPGLGVGSDLGGGGGEGGGVGGEGKAG